MLRAANAPEATADPMADAVAGLIVICAGVAVAMALPAVVPVAVAFGADRLTTANAPEAVALFVAVAVAVAGEILSAANDPAPKPEAVAVAFGAAMVRLIQMLALPPADAVAVGAVIVIAAHAPVADALPDALDVGAATDTAENVPDAVALTDPPADTVSLTYPPPGIRRCAEPVSLM
jgi:hypothetical protein